MPATQGEKYFSYWARSAIVDVLYSLPDRFVNVFLSEDVKQTQCGFHATSDDLSRVVNSRTNDLRGFLDAFHNLVSLVVDSLDGIWFTDGLKILQGVAAQIAVY